MIGGGSSGAYTAVRLGDSGKSVVLVEQTDRLGGHCQTYADFPSGQAVTGYAPPRPPCSNSALYEKTTGFLGDDVLLRTTIVAAQRDDGVVLLADSPGGPLIIKAQKIVITIPSPPGALAPCQVHDIHRGSRKALSRAGDWRGCSGSVSVPPLRVKWAVGEVPVVRVLFRRSLLDPPRSAPGKRCARCGGACSRSGAESVLDDSRPARRPGNTDSPVRRALLLSSMPSFDPRPW